MIFLFLCLYLLPVLLFLLWFLINSIRTQLEVLVSNKGAKMIKYCYDYNGLTRKPFACVVGIKENGELKIGYSICNPIDQFTKKDGRVLATQRAMEGNSPDLANCVVNDVVNTMQFCHATKTKWLGPIPKNVAIQQTIDFIKERLS